MCFPVVRYGFGAREFASSVNPSRTRIALCVLRAVSVRDNASSNIPRAHNSLTAISMREVKRGWWKVLASLRVLAKISPETFSASRNCPIASFNLLSTVVSASLTDTDIFDLFHKISPAKLQAKISRSIMPKLNKKSTASARRIFARVQGVSADCD